jgi:hypothetical protein
VCSLWCTVKIISKITLFWYTIVYWSYYIPQVLVPNNTALRYVGPVRHHKLLLSPHTSHLKKMQAFCWFNAGLTTCQMRQMPRASGFTVPRPFLREYCHFLLGYTHFRCLAYLGPLGLGVTLVRSRENIRTRVHIISSCVELLYYDPVYTCWPNNLARQAIVSFIIDANKLKYWKILFNIFVCL